METDLKALRYTLFGGVRKNAHLPYYVRGFCRLAIPRAFTEHQRKGLLNQLESLPSNEQDYIRHRVDYYCRLSTPCPLPADAPALSDQHYRHRHYPSVYFFDSYEINRYFPASLHWCFAPGDITNTFDVPTVCKSRPIGEPSFNKNSIIINLDKIRHFLFFQDPIPFEQKTGRAIFRGATHSKPQRAYFIETYFDHPLFDLRCTSTNSIYPEHMRQRKEMSIYKHLEFKYIMALEGNDVASNLKWVMNSNSIAVSPALNYETWFMEGQLIPGEHFIEIKPDFSDIVERLEYYNDHPAEALDIIAAAHEYTSQFQNPERERLIALLTMQKYFEMTGQTV